MDPVERPHLPYTIGAPDWNQFSDSVRCLDERPTEDASDWLYSVLSVFSKVYTVAKIVATILMQYGVELDDMPDGLLYHVKRTEEVVGSDSIANLIDAVEGLYYALFARLIMEMANVDLCSCFHLNLHGMTGKASCTLPEPTHLFKILLFCKRMLESPAICLHIHKELVRQHQSEYVRRAISRFESMGVFLDDLLGYRRDIMSVASDSSSAFRQKWTNGILLYDMPPEEVLTVLSERYLALTPKVTFQDELPTSELPFVNSELADPEVWERELIKDHRQATLAKLEGKSVGDVRRVDERRRLSDYVKENKCICRSSCTCAWDCTLDPERPCPCAERQMRVLLVKRRKGVSPREFGARCSSLAKAIFQGISCLRRDVEDQEIAKEFDRALLLFAEEIQKQRLTTAKANGVKCLSDD
ncbi:uncharacterized protein LDX57_009516 [Aspergillus melleus]|uniref:uncharacterized protein n=1 Tax=Aspergillus melleus TaxID=138277 RepID=UPI001E8D7D10|nr:uncharacterized protein LDX57_009516 [Aspergillus melleus]KAH8431865.1 hypothetical protein LDX57_009516 [Aspergillus melleus]